MRRTRIAMAGLAALFAAAGCDERRNPMVAGLATDAAGGSASFNVSPATVTVDQGQSVTLTLNSSRALGPYTWTSNQPGIASVSSDGVVTGVGPGVATISVTSGVDRTVSARSVVTVRSAPPGGTTGG